MSLFSRLNLAKLWRPTVPSNMIVSERLPLNEGEILDSDLFDPAVAFWFANRVDCGPPDWSVFVPEHHRGLLANVILYEQVDGRYLTRLVGDAVMDHLPVNPVGKFIDEVLPEDRLFDVTMRLDRAVSDELPNFVEKAKVWEHSGATFGYDALSMPFVSRNGGNNRILCMLRFEIKRNQEL